MTMSAPGNNPGDTGSIAALGRRVSQWLRSVYWSSRAKTIALDFDVSETTAKNWLRGHAPTTEHLVEMSDRWGPKFTRFALHGDAEPSIEDRISALEAEVGAMHALLEQGHALDQQRACGHSSYQPGLGQVLAQAV